MAVTVRPHVAGNVTNLTSATTTASAAKPNGLAVGDVWLIQHIRRSANAETGVPPGFSVLGPTLTISSAIIRTYYKVADAADVAGGAKTWTQLSAIAQTVSIAIAGANVAGTIFDAESPVDATDASSPFSTAGLTPDAAGVLMVLYGNATVQSTWTPPTTQGGGWTEQHDSQLDGGAAASRASQGMSYKAQAAGGATGAISVVGSVTTQSTGIRAIHINEAPAGDTTAPTAPTSLSATDVASPVLTWTQGTDAVGVTRNKIKRSTTSGSGYVEIADIAAATTYTDTSAAAGTTYYYVVTALDAALNESPNSTQDAATTPAVPFRVTKDIDLRWRVSVPVSKDIDLRWRVQAVKNTDVRVTFPAPPDDLVTGAGLQTFHIEARKVGSGVNPTLTAYLYEAGTNKATLLSGVAIPDASETFSPTWDAALLSDITGGGVELRVLINGNTDGYGELVDARWSATHLPTSTVRVSKDIDLRWRVEELAVPVRVWQDIDLRWRVAQTVQQDIALRWRVAQIVSKDIDLRWRVYRAVSQDIALRWRVLQSVSQSIDLRWRVAVKVQKDIDLRWRVAQTVSKDIDLRWRVASAAPFRVTQDIDLRWRVLRSVSQSIDLRWRVAQTVSKDVDLRWRVYVPVSKDISLQWRVLQSVGTSIDLRWRVAQKVQKDIDLQWRVQGAPGKVAKDISLQWRVAARVQKDIDLRWRIAQRVSQDVDLRWRVYFTIQKDIALQWRVAQKVLKDIELQWRVAGVVASRVTKDIDLRWRVAVRLQKDVELRWRVLELVPFRVTKDIDLRWRTIGRVQRDIDLRWRILSETLEVIVEGRVKPKIYAEGAVKPKMQGVWEVSPKIYAEGKMKPKAYATGQVRP